VSRWEIRVIRRNLYWLKPNLQKVQQHTRRKDARYRRWPLRQDTRQPAVILWGTERYPVRIFKEMSGSPKSR
jgi:hypothetical protein